MRLKEWHRIMVGGRPVFHVLEPAYYRQGKTNVRMVGIWYCPECDDIIDMRLLSKQGFVRKTHLHARFTSMFEKGLRFERKPRLDVERSSPSGVNVPEATEVPVGLQDKIDDGGFEYEVEKENYENGLPRKDNKGNIIQESTWRFAMTHGNYSCPCGSGKKYKKCHGK